MAAEHSTRHALTSSSWLLHSAASSHVTNDKSILSSYSPLENVTIGIGSRPAIGTGTAELEFYVRSKRTKVTLLNVLYVPSSPHNFLSMGKLHRAGYSITFLPDSLDVDIRTKAGVRLAHCRNIGDVYALGNVIPILPDTEDDYDLPPASSNPISLEGERQSDSEQQSSRSAPISHTTDTTDTRPPSTPGPPKAPASSSPSTPPSSQPRPTAQSSTGQRNASPPRATSLAPTMSTLTPMSSRNATPEQSPPPPKAPRDIDSRISEDNIILGPRTRKYAKPGSAFMARYATVGTTHIAFIATVSTTHPLAEDSSTLRTLTHTSLSNPSSHSRHRLHAPHTKTKFENSARLEFEGEC
ncbi:hypothetical protein C8F01DRAFT_1175395 [Mycena amicta]|nr:hypothetical protein C8F01DRAFT_1180557 [Mycena amicta]KAJ7051267.1 hypothetical protein C8F01DRAFT_1175395 [Mycena amicta]